MYQCFKADKEHLRNKFYSYRGLHDLIYATLENATKLHVTEPRDTMSGKKKIPYSKYVISAIDRNDILTTIEIHTRKDMYANSYKDPRGEITGRHFKGDHHLAILFPWGSLSNKRQSYFITTREGQCWCYESGLNDCLVHTSTYAEESMIGLLKLLRRVKSLSETYFIGKECPFVTIGDLEVNKIISREEKHLKKDIFTVDELLTKMKQYTNTECYVEQVKDGYVNTILTLKGSDRHHVFRIEARTGFHSSMYTYGDPDISIHIPRYFGSMEEQTLDIMEMGNNYVFRNHRFDVVDQSHGAAMDPSMLSLISYLADRGVKGSLLQTENYDKSHYLEL